MYDSVQMGDSTSHSLARSFSISGERGSPSQQGGPVGPGQMGRDDIPSRQPGSNYAHPSQQQMG
jgi:hypothetical protein